MVKFLKTVEIILFLMKYITQIIELVIRAEDAFSPPIIKHLIGVEERILEELAWKGNSPLWVQMGEQVVGDCAPLCEEVGCFVCLYLIF